MRYTALLSCLLLAGCWRSTGSEVVVYTALDSEFSAPILHKFAAASDIAVLPKFDVESTKTVGLAEAIVAEKDRPRCDVFWNNEILHTLRLERLGLLDAYRPPIAEQYPAAYRDRPRGIGTALPPGHRVLIVNTTTGRPAGPRPHLDPRPGRPEVARPRGRWPSRCSAPPPPMPPACSPSGATTRPRSSSGKLKRNEVQILSGNKQVAHGRRRRPDRLRPDRHRRRADRDREGNAGGDRLSRPGPGGLGTLFIPNTLAIIRGCPHPAAARRLVDYLLSPEVETMLAAGPSTQIPLNPNVRAPSRREDPADRPPDAGRFRRRRRKVGHRGEVSPRRIQRRMTADEEQASSPDRSPIGAAKPREDYAAKSSPPVPLAHR